MAGPCVDAWASWSVTLRSGRSMLSLTPLDAGDGQALLLEGHAGMGKTRLHEAALDEARRRGIRVLRAAGAELEQNLALGVAGQLVRALLYQLPEDARRAFLAEAPERVRSLAGRRVRSPGPTRWVT